MKPVISLVLLLPGIFWSSLLFAQTDTFELGLEMELTPYRNFTYLEDPEGELTFEEVRSSEVASSFKPNETYEDGLLPEISTYWLHFYLRNSSDAYGQWVIESPGWELLDMYLLEGGEITEIKQSGHLSKYAGRDYKVANRNYFRIGLSGGETVECYVRAEILRKNVEPFPVNLNLFILSREKQERSDRFIQSMILMFVGILLTMFFYNLFIYFSTRDKNYLWYLGTVLCLTYLTANNSGYLHALLGDWEPFLDLRVPVVLAVVALQVFFALNFTRSFLNIKTRYPFWNKLFNVLIGLAVVTYLLNYVQFELGWNLSNLVNLVTVLSILMVALRSTLTGYPGARIFLLAIGSSMLGAMLLLLAIVGVLEYNLFTGWLSLPTGSTLEAIFFSLALANRINVLKAEKEASQQQAIVAARKNEQLVREQNVVLEQKVEERTAEIVQQKEIIEKERDRSDGLLMNILPRSTAEELKEFGRAKPKYYESVSILFADVEGFTPIAERLSPEELVKDLDFLFEHLDEIITRNNLEKIKTIGDAYMCVGGLPEKNDTHAADATIAGLEILDFVEAWNREMVERGETPWQLRVGINTGSVTAGVVGRKKFAYDIWGDAVNLAARIESSGVPGKVNVSENTWNLIKEAFAGEYRGKVKVKGKGKVSMYFISGKKEK